MKNKLKLVFFLIFVALFIFGCTTNIPADDSGDVVGSEDQVQASGEFDDGLDDALEELDIVEEG